MRVAICLSGFMRCFDYTSKYLLDFLATQHETDIFISTWNVVGLSQHKMSFRRKLEQPVTEKMLKAYYGHRLKRWQIDDFYYYSPNFDEFSLQSRARGGHTTGLPPDWDCDRASRILSMCFKISTCNDLRREYEARYGFRYDVLVRCRPDLLFQQHVHIGPEDAWDHTLTVPDIESYGHLNDQVAFAGQEVMDRYASVLHYIRLYDQEGRNITAPEEMLRRHIIEGGNHIRIRKDVYYVRAEG